MSTASITSSLLMLSRWVGEKVSVIDSHKGCLFKKSLFSAPIWIVIASVPVFLQIKPSSGVILALVLFTYTRGASSLFSGYPWMDDAAAMTYTTKKIKSVTFQNICVLTRNKIEFKILANIFQAFLQNNSNDTKLICAEIPVFIQFLSWPRFTLWPGNRALERSRFSVPKLLLARLPAPAPGLP